MTWQSNTWLITNVRMCVRPRRKWAFMSGRRLRLCPLLPLGNSFADFGADHAPQPSAYDPADDTSYGTEAPQGQSKATTAPMMIPVAVSEQRRKRACTLVVTQFEMGYQEP